MKVLLWFVMWCDIYILHLRSWWSTSVSWSTRWARWPVPSGALPWSPLQVNGDTHQSTVCCADVNNKPVNHYSTAALNIDKSGQCHPQWSVDHFLFAIVPCVAVSGRPASVLSDSEDENPEALQTLHSPRPLGHYSLCEQGQLDSLLLASPPPSPKEMERSTVVINQPAPLSSPHQASTETHSSDSVRSNSVKVLNAMLDTAVLLDWCAMLYRLFYTKSDCKCLNEDAWCW